MKIGYVISDRSASRDGNDPTKGLPAGAGSAQNETRVRFLLPPIGSSFSSSPPTNAVLATRLKFAHYAWSSSLVVSTSLHLTLADLLHTEAPPRHPLQPSDMAPVTSLEVSWPTREVVLPPLLLLHHHKTSNRVLSTRCKTLPMHRALHSPLRAHLPATSKALVLMDPVCDQEKRLEQTQFDVNDNLSISIRSSSSHCFSWSWKGP